MPGQKAAVFLIEGNREYYIDHQDYTHREKLMGTLRRCINCLQTRNFTVKLLAFWTKNAPMPHPRINVGYSMDN